MSIARLAKTVTSNVPKACRSNVRCKFAEIILHVLLPLLWDGNLILFSDVIWSLTLNIFSATRIDSVSLVGSGVPFAIEDMAKMAPAISTRSLGHALTPTQQDMSLVPRKETFVVSVPTSVFKFRASAVEWEVACLALEVTFLREEAAILAPSCWLRASLA